MAPGKIETFRFGDLLTAKNVVKRIAGVDRDSGTGAEEQGLWEAHVRVRFDEAGNSLETFRGWILQNEAVPRRPRTAKPSPTSSQESRTRARMKSA